jgi:hypothetical protein
MFNPCVPWHLVALHACVAVRVSVSHICYDIVEGFCYCCLAMFVRKVPGGSRLLYWVVQGLRLASLVSRCGRRNCVYMRTHPPAVLFPFPFLLTQLFGYLN